MVNRMIHLADYAKGHPLDEYLRIMERKHKASVDSTLQVIDSYKKRAFYMAGRICFCLILLSLKGYCSMESIAHW